MHRKLEQENAMLKQQVEGLMVDLNLAFHQSSQQLQESKLARDAQKQLQDTVSELKNQAQMLTNEKNGLRSQLNDALRRERQKGIQLEMLKENRIRVSGWQKAEQQKVAEALQRLNAQIEQQAVKEAAMKEQLSAVKLAKEMQSKQLFECQQSLLTVISQRDEFSLAAQKANELQLQLTDTQQRATQLRSVWSEVREEWMREQKAMQSALCVGLQQVLDRVCVFEEDKRQLQGRVEEQLEQQQQQQQQPHNQRTPSRLEKLMLLTQSPLHSESKHNQPLAFHRILSFARILPYATDSVLKYVHGGSECRFVGKMHTTKKFVFDKIFGSRSQSLECFRHVARKAFSSLQRNNSVCLLSCASCETPIQTEHVSYTLKLLTDQFQSLELRMCSLASNKPLDFLSGLSVSTFHFSELRSISVNPDNIDSFCDQLIQISSPSLIALTGPCKVALIVLPMLKEQQMFAWFQQFTALLHSEPLSSPLFQIASSLLSPGVDICCLLSFVSADLAHFLPSLHLLDFSQSCVSV